MGRREHLLPSVPDKLIILVINGAHVALKDELVAARGALPPLKEVAAVGTVALAARTHVALEWPLAGDGMLLKLASATRQQRCHHLAAASFSAAAFAVATAAAAAASASAETAAARAAACELGACASQTSASAPLAAASLVACAAAASAASAAAASVEQSCSGQVQPLPPFVAA
eukprot:1582265-Prymnesium_polylepis.1